MCSACVCVRVVCLCRTNCECWRPHQEIHEQREDRAGVSDGWRGWVGRKDDGREVGEEGFTSLAAL